MLEFANLGLLLFSRASTGYYWACCARRLVLLSNRQMPCNWVPIHFVPHVFVCGFRSCMCQFYVDMAILHELHQWSHFSLNSFNFVSLDLDGQYYRIQSSEVDS